MRGIGRWAPLCAAAILAVWSGPTQAQQMAGLASDLSGVLGNGWRGATWGVAVVSLDTGDTLFAVEPARPLAPASNLKLLTSAAALEILGPEYRFRTYLMTDGVVADGTVHGDLVLYGTGDPGLSDRFFRRKEEVFHRLVDELVGLGIHTVTGDLVGDASFLGGPLRPEGWDARDLNDHFAAAVSALSFNENVVSFRIVPGAPGEPPQVFTVPDHAGLEVVNNVVTGPRGTSGRVHILRDNPLEPVRIEGQIGAGARDVWREMTVPVPAHFAISVFRSVLEARGIEVAGTLRVVDSAEASVLGRLHAPATGRARPRILARHVSEPLVEYLEIVNKQSNNLFAELVFRSLGRAREGSGTPEAGARAVNRSLSRLGVDMGQVVQVDGSGLSGDNRVSALTFVSVMERMSESNYWDAFWTTLPEAGRRGGLGRMYNTAAAGNLRAKTGTIEGVSALSGLVRSRDGERLAFSILVNGTSSTSRAKRVENLMGALLADFRRPAPASSPVTFVMAEAPAVDATERHQVARGENLSAIAGRYGISLDDLVRANPLLEPNRIVAGEWLAIPQRTGS